MQIYKGGIQFIWLIARQWHNECRGDAPVRFAVLIRLNDGVLLAVLQHQCGPVFQYLYHLALDACVAYASTNQGAQLFKADGCVWHVYTIPMQHPESPIFRLGQGWIMNQRSG